MLSLNNLSGGGSPEAASPPVVETSSLYVWGANDSGQLGMGDTTDRPTITNNTNVTLAKFLGNTSAAATSIIFSNNTEFVKGAGENQLGQLGDGSEINRSSFVNSTALTSNVSSLESSERFSAYSDGGTASIARNNNVTTTEINIGVKLTGGGSTNDWSAEVPTWSWSPGGLSGPINEQLEANGTMEMTTPVSMGLGKISSENRGAVGIYIPQLVTSDGDRQRNWTDQYDILIWTNNGNATLLSELANILDSKEWKKVVVGGRYTTLMLDSFNVYSLTQGIEDEGLNEYGEAGQNAATGSSVSFGAWFTEGSKGVPATTDIAGNRYNSFAIRGGELFASGSFQTGCVGAATENVLEPIQLGSAENWVEIQAGEACMIARNSDGELWFIGNNSNGQAGDGTTGAIITTLTRIDSSNTYDSYLVTAKSVYANRTT